MDQAELEALAIQIRDEVGAGANTATRVGTEMLNHIQSQVISSDYRAFGCILRNTGAGWFALDDADHTPLNIDSVSNDNVVVTIDYTSLGVTEVLSAVVCGDETFAPLYTIGPSVGFTSASFRIDQLERTGLALITHNGSGVFSVTNQGGSSFTNLGHTYFNTIPRLVITHDDADGMPAFYDMGGNTDIRAQQNQFVFSQVSVDLWNKDNTQQTLLDPEVNRFLYGRNVSSARRVDPDDIVSAAGNFWVVGFMKIS